MAWMPGLGKHSHVTMAGLPLGDTDQLVVQPPKKIMGVRPLGVVQRVVICPSHLVSRSEEHTSELQSLMRISYAVFCLKKKIYEIPKARKTPLLHKYQQYAARTPTTD